MDSLQKYALETLIKRELTLSEIANIDQYLPQRNDVAIAECLPKRSNLKTTPIGIGTILAVLAPNGGAFLDALEQAGQTDPNVKWALKLIEQSNFDLGMESTRVQMSIFAEQVPYFKSGIAVLLKLAEEEIPINFNEVSDVLNMAEGRLVL